MVRSLFLKRCLPSLWELLPPLVALVPDTLAREPKRVLQNMRGSMSSLSLSSFISLPSPPSLPLTLVVPR